MLGFLIVPWTLGTIRPGPRSTPSAEAVSLALAAGCHSHADASGGGGASGRLLEALDNPRDRGAAAARRALVIPRPSGVELDQNSSAPRQAIRRLIGSPLTHDRRRNLSD
jgi:hypothetical protein